MQLAVNKEFLLLIQMKHLALGAIRLYQRWLSGSTLLFLRVFGFSEAGCRFTPRCSEYTYQAIEKYGLVKGSRLGLRRILHCHPWSRGGYEPVI